MEVFHGGTISEGKALDLACWLKVDASTTLPPRGYLPAVAVAMAPKGWAPPCLESMLTFEGGYTRERFPVKSLQIGTPDHGKVTFAHFEKNAEWILQGSVGTAEKATLKRSKLFKTLKEKLMAAVAAEGEDTVAVAAGSGAAAEERADDDPMNQLRDIATPEKKI